MRHLSAGLHIVMTDLRTGLLKFGYAESEDRLNNLVNLLIEWDFAVIENLQHADFFADECVPDDGRCPSSVCVCVRSLLCMSLIQDWRSGALARKTRYLGEGP